MLQYRMISLVVALFLLGSCSGSRPIKVGDTIRPTDFGQLALHQGSLVERAQGGLWVTFWATWCEPCRAEWPDLELAAQTLAVDGVTIVAVNVGESAAQIDQFLDQQRTSFTVLRDEDGTFAARWGVYGMPTHVLIDASGKVIRVVRGPLNAQRARAFFGLAQPAAEFVPLGDGN